MPQETEAQQVTRIAVAKDLIRGPFWSRLFDRAFLLPLLACIGVWYAALKNLIPIRDAVEYTVYLAGGFAVIEKAKDALIGAAAVKPPKGDGDGIPQ